MLRRMRRVGILMDDLVSNGLDARLELVEMKKMESDDYRRAVALRNCGYVFYVYVGRRIWVHWLLSN